MTVRNTEFSTLLIPQQELLVPLYELSLKATFNGLYADVSIEQIDLVKEIMPRPSCTNFMCAGGTNIKDESVQSDDWVVTDMSLKYKDGKKIACWLKEYEGWTVKTLRIRRDGHYLESTNPNENTFRHKLTKYDTPLGMVTWIMYKEFHARNSGFRPGFFPECEPQVVNLEQLLKHRPSSTFYAKADGNSMSDDRILNGDILVVDKSLEYIEKKKIVYWLQDYYGFTVKNLKIQNGETYLVPANKIMYPNFEYKVKEYDKPWGMVTWNLHNEYKKEKDVRAF